MDYRVVLVVTGGGSRAIPQLLARCGASRTVLEATVPYHPAALAEYVGGRVERACSEPTALRMAVAAYRRAEHLIAAERAAAPSDERGDAERQIAGVACTAALATDRPRRGRDRAFVAVHTRNRTQSWTADLDHVPSDRNAQETLAANLVAAAVRTLGITVDAGSEASLPSVQREQIAPASWVELSEGTIAAVAAKEDRAVADTPAARALLLFPGSFDPLHEGHLEMARIAAQRYGREVTYELSIANADKPPLDYLTIAERVEQFTRSDLPLLLTRSPRFDQKAALFPGSTFLIGADTAIRLADPRFYDHDPDRRDAAIRDIAKAGCRFLLFGRRLERGFADPQSLELPPAIVDLCDCVPESQFRNDISSTQLRKMRG